MKEKQREKKVKENFKTERKKKTNRKEKRRQGKSERFANSNSHMPRRERQKKVKADEYFFHSIFCLSGIFLLAIVIFLVFYRWLPLVPFLEMWPVVKKFQYFWASIQNFKLG